jgi:arylsulfatase A-like enzyme
MSNRPNIVLIFVDQWRGDCLSIDGHLVVHTPHLDQLALEGTRFKRAYAAVPSCIASRAALLTGYSQAKHGRVGYQDGVPWDYPVTIASEFTRHGYQTQAIGKMHVYPARSQMGFQNVVLHDGYMNFQRGESDNYDYIDDYLPWLRMQLGRDADYFEHGVQSNSVLARPWDKPEFTHPTNWVVEQSINFLKRRDPRKPFFLFMSFHRPHPPYDPPAWAFDQYLNQTMPDVPIGDWSDIFDDDANPYLHECFAGNINPRMLHRARAGYYGHMSHIDHQIGRFVKSIRENGLRDNTFICFVSDHGELMGDHHLFRKGLPYEGSARVPLILWAPSSYKIESNSSHDQVVELRDVMPTLLDCAALQTPDSVEGLSFLSIAQGESTELRTHLHGEHVRDNQSVQWLTDGKEKYIWFSGRGHEQLFDLKEDPNELHNLAGQSVLADRITHWRQMLIRELVDREEGFTDGKRLITGRPVNPCLSHLRQYTGLK